MKNLIATGLLLISTNTFANQTDIDAIELASMQFNQQALSQAIESNQGYLKALANYRLSVSQQVKGDVQSAIKTLDKAVQGLEQVVLDTPNDDEAWALLSQCYGLKIGFQPMLGATFGPKAGQALEKAKALDPTNPRIALFKGIMLFSTPEMYGGSKTQAVKAFDKAIALFADDKNSGTHWGEAETYVWRGLSYQAINQSEKATENFEQALNISPDFGWAKMLLANSAI